MLITLGEGDKALKCLPYGEYYQSSTNTEQELYFDLYHIKIRINTIVTPVGGIVRLGTPSTCVEMVLLYMEV